MKITFAKELEIYTTEHGGRPFVEWLESIKDGKMRARIKERLERVRLGNMGDCKYIEEGVSELRLAFGPGYRIYFGQNGSKQDLRKTHRNSWIFQFLNQIIPQ